MKRLLSFVIILGMVWWPGAEADEVCLNNGNTIEGIVVRDTDQILELKVFPEARISFSKQDIAYVKSWDEKENQALEEKWFKEREERREAERIRQEFEAKQRSKGLIKYKGKWIEKTEKEQLETREYIDAVLKSKTERGEIVKSDQRERTEIARTLLARGSWHFRQTQHFTIYYEDVIQSKIVADRCEYYYEKIAYDLDYETIYWPQRCEVFILPSEQKWEEYMQGLVERFDHIGGFVPRSGEREIYLCALSLPYLSVTFPHELTHLIFGEFAKDTPIPLWLNEGLAIYESGLIGYADAMLRDKVQAAEHIPLKELVEAKDYPRTKEEVALYYAQAEKIVEFLITQHGRKQFSHFCRILIDGRSFSEALDLVYGNTYYGQDEFKRAWIKYVLR